MSFNEKIADNVVNSLSIPLSGSRRVSSVNLLAANLTGNTAHFTVSNGPIKIYTLGALVTTAIPAGANTLKIQFTPTGGSATDLCAATDTASTAVNKILKVDGTKATALVVSTDAGISAAGQADTMPIMVGSGTINTVFSAGAPATGAMTLFVEWEPLTTTAAVATV